MNKEPKQPRGRPEMRIIKLDATPEQAARAIFSAVSKPDPSLRVVKSVKPETKPK